MSTFAALLTSRKFFIGTLTIAAIIATAALVAMGKLPASELTSTIAGITAIGIGVIGSIAYEDGAKHAAGTPPAKPEVSNAKPPALPAPDTTPSVDLGEDDDKPTPTPS